MSDQANQTDKKRALSFTGLIATIIIGVALYRLYDAEQMTFRKPGLAIVYAIGLMISLFLLFGNFIKKRR